MVGSSMMMASFGFMIYAISPAYSNSEKDKTEIKNTGIPNSSVGTNGVIIGSSWFFVEAGYMYSIKTSDVDQWLYNGTPAGVLKKRKLF